MRFCDVCGSMLLPSKTKENAVVLKCKCGAIYPMSPDDKKAYKMRETVDNKGKETVVLNEDAEKQRGAISKTCPKCGNDKALFFEIPPMWGDEETVHKYRCTKCGFTFNEGSGLGW